MFARPRTGTCWLLSLSLLCSSCSLAMVGEASKRKRGDFLFPAVVDVALAIVGTVVTVKLSRDEAAEANTIDRCDNHELPKEQQHTCWSTAALLGTILAGASGILGVALAATEARVEEKAPAVRAPTPEETRTARAVAEEQAGRQLRMYYELAATATSAARSGDCATVVKLDPELRRLARGRYTSALKSNAELAACLGTNEEDGRATPVAEPDPDAPPTLDRAMIQRGLDGIMPAAMECRASVKGAVVLSIKVASDGSVVYAMVLSTPDRALGDCVAAAVRGATFARTREATTFRFPFTF